MTTLLASLSKRLRQYSLTEKQPWTPPAQPLSIPGPQLDLAALPAEIRLALLKAVDNPYALRCLANSSAALFHLYKENRQAVLESVMGRSIDLALLPEAVFCSATNRIDFAAADAATQISHYLQRFHLCKHSSAKDRLPSIVNDWDQARYMKRLYWTIDALGADYCDRASAHLEVADDNPITYSSLSGSEKFRLRRAFFRYELFCNLYRDQGICLDYLSHQYAPGLNSYNKDFVYRDDYDETKIDDETKSRQFLLPFHAWEVEEFACIHDYMLRRWSEIMADFEFHFAARNPRFAAHFAERPETPEGCLDLSPQSWGYDGFRWHFSLLGLDFLRTFLQPETSLEHRQTLIEHNILYGTCDPQSVIDDYNYRSKVQEEAEAELNPPRRSKSFTAERANLAPNPGWKPWETELARTMPTPRPNDTMRQSGCIFWDTGRIESLVTTLRENRRKNQGASEVEEAM